MSENAGASLFVRDPVIVSEVKIDFSELFRTNRTIVHSVLNADTNVVAKIGILERLLPGLAAAGDCACSCACQCACSCS